MIRGELVNLRAVERGDTPIIHRWMNDPEVMRGWGLSAAACSVQDIARDVETWLDQEGMQGRPTGLIAESLEGEPVGLVILRVDRPESRSWELSLLVGDPRQWGRGLGKDIVQATLEACFNGWGAHRLGVRVEEDNVRALALYQRFRFQREGLLRQGAFREGQYADILLFGLLASEWRAADG